MHRLSRILEACTWILVIGGAFLGSMLIIVHVVQHWNK